MRKVHELLDAYRDSHKLSTEELQLLYDKLEDMRDLALQLGSVFDTTMEFCNTRLQSIGPTLAARREKQFGKSSPVRPRRPQPILKV